jgi:hypothetical protein
MPDLLARLAELEADIHYKTPPPAGERDFGYAFGRLPILLSAPHGAAHQRNGRLKAEDDFTAGMVRLVAEQTGAHPSTYSLSSGRQILTAAALQQFLAGIVRRYRILLCSTCTARRRTVLWAGPGHLERRELPAHAIELSVLDHTAYGKTPLAAPLDLITFSGMGVQGGNHHPLCVATPAVPAAQWRQCHLRARRHQCHERDPFQTTPGIERTLKILAALCARWCAFANLDRPGFLVQFKRSSIIIALIHKNTSLLADLCHFFNLTIHRVECRFSRIFIY